MAVDNTKYYDLLDGPNGLPASSGGYWHDNERAAQGSAVSLAGTPVTRQHFFGPDYATANGSTPTATPIQDHA